MSSECIESVLSTAITHKTGRVKIINSSDNYVPTPDDGATLIIIE